MRPPGSEKAVVVTMETRVQPIKKAFLCIPPECLTSCKM